MIGQPDFISNTANNATKLCAATGKDADGKDTFPTRCAKTLDFPRFALSDGRRLFVSDGGNDRILIFNSIPTQNAPAADVILGQLSETLNLTTDNINGPEGFPNKATAADVFRTPGALALLNGDLFVSDPYGRRVLVYTPAEQKVPPTGVRNAASREIFAVASVTLAGSLKENDEVTVKIADKEYKYKITKTNADNKDFRAVLKGLFDAINAGSGDPKALATINRQKRALGTVVCRDIMTRNVTSVAPQTPLSAVWEVLRQRGIRGVPVVGEDGAVAGMVAISDFLKNTDWNWNRRGRLRCLLTSPRKAPAVAADIMTSPVISLREDSHVAELFATFASHGINHVPVIDAGGRLTGIITRLDLLNLFANQAEDRKAS